MSFDKDHRAGFYSYGLTLLLIAGAIVAVFAVTVWFTLWGVTSYLIRKLENA